MSLTHQYTYQTEPSGSELYDNVRFSIGAAPATRIRIDNESQRLEIDVMNGDIQGNGNFYNDGDDRKPNHYAEKIRNYGLDVTISAGTAYPIETKKLTIPFEGKKEQLERFLNSFEAEYLLPQQARNSLSEMLGISPSHIVYAR